jgi:hypothetical protein
VLEGISLEVIVGLVGAALVVAIGTLLAHRQTAAVGESQEIPQIKFSASSDLLTQINAGMCTSSGIL